MQPRGHLPARSWRQRERLVRALRPGPVCGPRLGRMHRVPPGRCAQPPRHVRPLLQHHHRRRRRVRAVRGRHLPQHGHVRLRAMQPRDLRLPRQRQLRAVPRRLVRQRLRLPHGARLGLPAAAAAGEGRARGRAQGPWLLGCTCASSPWQHNLLLGELVTLKCSCAATQPLPPAVPPVPGRGLRRRGGRPHLHRLPGWHDDARSRHGGSGSVRCL